MSTATPPILVQAFELADAGGERTLFQGDRPHPRDLLWTTFSGDKEGFELLDVEDKDLTRFAP